MYRIKILNSEKYIDTFRYQQKIKQYDIILIYRPKLILDIVCTLIRCAISRVNEVYVLVAVHMSH